MDQDSCGRAEKPSDVSLEFLMCCSLDVPGDILLIRTTLEGAKEGP